MPLLLKSSWIFGVPSKLEGGLLVVICLLVIHLHKSQCHWPGNATYDIMHLQGTMRLEAQHVWPSA